MNVYFNPRFIFLILLLISAPCGIRAEELAKQTLTAAPSYLLIKEKPGVTKALDAFLKSANIVTLYSFAEAQPIRILEIPGATKTGEVLVMLETTGLIATSAVDITAGNSSLSLLMKNINAPKSTAVVSPQDSVEQGISVLLQMKPGLSLADSAAIHAAVGAKFLRAFGEAGQYQVVEINSGVQGFHQMVSYLDNAMVQSALPALAQTADMFKGLALDRMLVKFEEGTTPADIASFRTSVGAESVQPIYPGSDTYRVRAQKGASATELYLKIKGSDKVSEVEPVVTRQSHAVPNDPLFTDGSVWGLFNNGRNGGVVGVDMNAELGWDVTTDATGLVVAIIDSGIHVNHEDLRANLWVNGDEIPGDGIDNDRNGYIDDVNGMNAEDGNGSIDDTGGHGTNVAGCVAALGNNGLGVVGVAWRAKLMICKFGDFDNDIPSENILACMDYAIKNGANIINCSFGGTTRTAAEFAKIKEARDAGILVIVSAGNSGRFFDNGNSDRRPLYPANYALDNIVSVGSINRTGAVSDFSNYGTCVSISAPGEEIVTTANSDVEGLKYEQTDGTSFAAPYVAGVAALVKSKFPGEGYLKDIERLLTRARELNTISPTGNATRSIPNISSAVRGSLSGTNPAVIFNGTQGIPLFIPDATAGVIGTASAPITISTTGVIQSLRLSLVVSHTYPSDLYMELTSPSGKKFTFTANNNNAGPGLPFEFDRFPIPYFTGEDAAGVWTLTMNDFVGGDFGSVTRWSLEVATYTTPPGPGSFAVTSSLECSEPGSANVEVFRSGGAVGTATVEYATRSGSAVAGTDFEATQGVLVFEDGETKKSITVQVLNDDEIEGQEEFYFDLSSATGGSLGGTKTCTIVIPKNDLGFFNFSAATFPVREGEGMVTITVNRDSYTDTPAAVYFSTSAGSATPGTAFAGGDYTPVQGWLLFPAGCKSQSFTVPISNEGETEMPETFQVNLSAPTRSASLGIMVPAIVEISD